jgi:lactobin A/cerein 7B family class IIb bacteriocin
MRNEMQNAETRELTTEELDVVSGGWGLATWIVGVAGGALWADNAMDAESRAADKK